MFENIIEKLDDNNTKEEIQEIINNDETYMEEIEKYVERVKKGEKKENIFEEIKQTINNSYLYDIISEDIDNELASFELTDYLRNMTYDEFIQHINPIFNNKYINKEFHEYVNEFKDIDLKKLFITEKVLSTVNDIIIVDGYEFNTFKSTCENLFGFDLKKSEYLWNIFKDKEDKIYKTNVILKLKNIEKKLNMFADILEEMFDTEE